MMTSLYAGVVFAIVLCLLVSVVFADHKSSYDYENRSSRRSSKPPSRKPPMNDWSYECTGRFFCGMFGYGYFRRAECVDKSLICNGIRDCPNGMDERDCPRDCGKMRMITCSDQSVCADPCDGRKQCPGGEDEIYCPFVCGPGMYKCEGPKEWCVSKDKLCNGVHDCPEYDDELLCDRACFCKPLQFLCPHSGECQDVPDACSDEATNSCL